FSPLPFTLSDDDWKVITGEDEAETRQADRHGGAALEPGGPDRVARHRPRQADPECLHRELQCPPARPTAQRDAVTSLAQVRAVLNAWKDDYNNARPHSALGNLTPTEFAARTAPGPQRGRRCATRRAPRPAPLLHRAPWAQMSLGLCSLLDEPRG